MTISTALSNALSGLRAAGRGAEVVSSNIANALTPGYGRRILNLSSMTIGNSGGVRIDGITRIVDASLAADRRMAEAEHVNRQGAVDFLARIERLLGTPDEPGALTARLSGLDRALVTAASRPEAPERLAAAVAEADGVAQSLNDLSAGIQNARGMADRTIAQQVERLNLSLQQMARLNTQITATQVQGGDVAGLLDERQRLVDEIGVLVPVRELQRDNGQIALYTTGGAVLLDGTAARLDFTPSNVVTPYMSLDGGTLSGLTINGVDVRTGSENGVLRGGAIAAQFAIRDELGVAAQAQVDAIARDLVARFQDPAVDITLGPGDAGLFTDAGNAFDPADELGLSARLRINAAVDPGQGGEAWRIRDGLGAAVPGAVGDASLIQRLSGALGAAVIPASGIATGGAFTAIDLVSVVTSDFAGQRSIAERQLTYASVRLAELTERQLADGVDSDAEISRLMLIEQAYAANARVIETVDELMQQILRL